jgi:FkbM family methyltransferase
MGVRGSDVLWVVLGFLVALPVPSLVGQLRAGGSGGGGTVRGAGLPLGGADGGDGGAGGAGAAAPAGRTMTVKRYKMDPDNFFCNKTARFPAELPPWDVIGAGPHSWPPAQCHWTDMWHPGVPMAPLRVCTHDPAEDGVISTFLHTYHFWGSPDDYNFLLAMGPCTAARPYMLDIGANLGVYTILGASRGCRSVSFEPLSGNILRLRQSLEGLGVAHNALLFKHAVGKAFAPVKIGFRPSNPGASALGVDGDVTERMEQITIDGLLLGGSPPVFANFTGPPISGATINFVKIDTEGYDVAVVSGMLKTIVEGRPPHILIEFGPNDAAGTAGCNPYRFVQFMYGAGYRMYEGAKAMPMRALLDVELPAALSGKGRRVFESWFIHDDAARHWVDLGLLQRYEVPPHGM